MSDIVSRTAVLLVIVAASCHAGNPAGPDGGATADTMPAVDPPGPPTEIAAAAIPVASTVTLLAGSDNIGGSLDATGTAARFQDVGDLAVDSAGTLYVTEAVGRIRKVTPDGVVTKFATVTLPKGIAINGAGTVFVHAGPRIQTISPAGVVSDLAGSDTEGAVDGKGAEASFDSRMGLGLDRDATVYVADFRNHRIRRVAADGTVTTIAGTTSGQADGPVQSAQFNLPWDVALDREGAIYVADSGNGLVRKISGSTVTSFATVTDANGLDVDRAGNVYVAQVAASRVSRITPSGVVTTVAQGIPFPRFVAVDGAGNVYVTCGQNIARGGGGAIRKIASVGIGELKVTWQAPGSDVAITGYTAAAAAPGRETQTCTAAAETTCTIRGLVTGVAYDVTVSATNAGGTSAASQSVNATPN